MTWWAWRIGATTNRINSRVGSSKRVAIARTLVTHPQLLVADEPTGNLDQNTGEQVLSLFARLHHDLNLTLIVATHDTSVAQRADYELHLVDGRLANKNR